MENINYFDVIVLALTIMLGFKGLLRGFIKEVFALLGITVGVNLASGNAQYIGKLISIKFIPIDNDNILLLTGFIATLILVWNVAYVLGIVMSKIFSLSGLGIFDRLLGFIFGTGKVFFIFAIIVYALSQVKVINEKLLKFTKNSVVYPKLKQVGKIIIQIDPIKVQNEITKNIDFAVKKTKKTMDSLKKDINITMGKI
jgi:membrane protein required for colicin V production